jgi:uncharacterized protein with LGFP repeats
MTSTRSTPARRRSLGAVLGALVSSVALVFGGLTPAQAADEAPAVVAKQAAAALSGSSFLPGLIISDSQFFDDDAMTASQVQSFLQGKIGTCSNTLCLNVYRQNTPSRAADAFCKAYVGASNESAATIIAKVQAACGVSAKALLVTLQKEQGLITHKGPTSSRLRIAMGYGCPDTAACDTLYYGFFNQVYSAARQLQKYGTGSFTWYPVGKVSNIRYHPNAACGTRSVKIENRATAALYYYTPYTPNAASLANLGGTGNSCSSYGNRNFWVFYSNWFGNPVVIDGASEISAEYARLGGSTGVLGAPLAPTPCAKGTRACSQAYENGFIGWSHGGGAFPVMEGEILDKWLAAGGVTGSWGAPTSAENPITGANGDGSGQNFQNIQALSSAAGTFAVRNEVKPLYGELGWVREGVGWPTANAVCRSSTLCAQQFTHAVLGFNGSAAYSVLDEFYDRYQAAGGLGGAWGIPTSGQNAISGTVVPGTGQNFEKAQLLSSTAGTFAIDQRLRSAYSAAGWVRGPLGWPAGDIVCVTSTRCAQEFAGGAIALNAGVTFVASGPIGERYLANGGPSGALGYPTSAANAISGTTGVGQNFQHGQIVRSSAGAFALSGALFTAYKANGWVRGPLGFPVADAVCASGTCSQEFQKGEIVLPPSGPAYVIASGPIGEKYLASGGPSGPLGYPTSAANPISGTTGSGQNFQNGQIVHSPAGAFILTGPIFTAYKANGWVRGALGFPVADAACAAGSCSQEFQNGEIVLPATGAAYVIASGPIGEKYLASGGPSGPLGYPTSAANPISGTTGSGQNFQKGQIVHSSAGAFILSGGLFTAYKANGWVRGALGFPVADAVCASGTCSQEFQNGEIVLPPSGTAYVNW